MAGKSSDSSPPPLCSWLCSRLGRPMLMSRLSIEDDYSRDRNMSWSELFFDLCFVSGVRRLGEMLRDGLSEVAEEEKHEAGEGRELAEESHVKALSLPEFLLLFMLLWSLWIQQSHYGTRWGSDDLYNKVGFGLFMLGVLGAICNLSPLHSHGNQWAMVSLAFAAAVSTVTHARIYCYYSHNAAGRYGVFYGTLSAMKMIVCVYAACSKPASYVVPISIVAAIPWLLPFTVGIFYPCIFEMKATTADGRKRAWYDRSDCGLHLPLEKYGFKLPVHLEHFTERMGLLMVIYLGDCVDNIASAEVSARSWVKLSLTFFLVLGLKFLFFDTAEMEADRHALRRHRFSAIIWDVIQPVQAIGLTLTSSGIAFVLSKHEQEQGRELLCMGVASVLFVFLVTKLLHVPNFVHVHVVCKVTSECRDKLEKLFYAQLVVNAVAVCFCIAAPSLLPIHLGPVPLLGALVVLLIVFNAISYVDTLVQEDLEEYEHEKALEEYEQEQAANPAKGGAQPQGQQDAASCNFERSLERKVARVFGDALTRTRARRLRGAQPDGNDLTESLLGQGMHAPPLVFNSGL